MENNAARIKLLKLWDILCEETDEEHPMSTTTIMKRLNDYGISVTRKTLYGDIELLNSCGYEVLCNRSKVNEYYVIDRKFDMPELHIILDALQAAAFIPRKKTQELVDKVAALGGNKSGDLLKRNIVAFNITKNINDSIFYSVNEIVTAIQAQKKVIFLYFDYDYLHERVYRKDGHHYVVSPLATVYSDDYYYLITYDNRHNKITHYRIDRMDKVEMVDDPCDPIPEDFLFSIAKHKRSVFNMYVGEEVTVRFSVRKDLLGVIFDKFGDIPFIAGDEDCYLFSANVQVSPTFIGWCCSFGRKLKVLSPDPVAEKIRKYTRKIAHAYGSEIVGYTEEEDQEDDF